MNERRILVLEGLNCAHCAARIEKAVQSQPGVKSAALDFISKKLTIEAEGAHIAGVVQNATNIAKKIESHINVYEEAHMHSNPETTEKRKLIMFISGFMIYIFVLFAELPFWAEISLFLGSYLLIGSEVIIKAFKNILRGEVFDENFLMSAATIGAFAIREYPEAVAVMIFYWVGEYFQELAVNRSRNSIKALMDIRPDYANLKRDAEIVKVSPVEVVPSDIIIIKPGERIPLDGHILEGFSALDTSALTGEALPREVEPGSEVLSGSINLNGLLSVKVSRMYKESTVAKILELTQNAAANKAKTENLITKLAHYYTPAVVFSAVALALLPPLFLPDTEFSVWINRALIFLVVSCPCALVISIPLGFFGGIGGASKKGILIKGSNYLEALNNVKTVVFDKTGTLTKGVFKVIKIKPFENIDGSKLLHYAALAESYSTHPIASSILQAYGKEPDRSLIAGSEEMPGFGIRTKAEGSVILAGNVKLMSRENITYPQADEAGTIVHIAIDNIYAGYLVISDEVKEDSSKAITDLRSLGVKKIVMFTGDSLKTGATIAKELGIDTVYTDLLPHNKVEKLILLEDAKLPGENIIFAGDGINDAPVLARADIGVAMGGVGSDAAIEAADIVLMTDEPSKLVTALKIAKRTRNIVWQNIIFAIFVKLIVLALGAGGLATMWEAVFADVGVALIAVLNASRAQVYQP